MRVIVVNSGSSSIKYETFDVSGLVAAAKGLLERIGAQDSRLRHRWLTPSGRWEEIVETRHVDDHRAGSSFILEVSSRERSGSAVPEIFAVGHRVVHGGERFSEPSLIDDVALRTIEELIPLAPLHNPANVTGIKVMRELLPDVPQVAVFDTAFHQTMPARAFHYALPADFYRSYGVRRYGFHGTSHQYVAGEAARHLGRPPDALNLITLHLGNGASAAAIERGQSIDTSMGLTPLEGLAMGTRCGDLDPAVHFYLARRTGRPFEEIEGILNKESGLKGICGVNDMREIQNRARGETRRLNSPSKYSATASENTSGRTTPPLAQWMPSSSQEALVRILPLCGLNPAKGCRPSELLLMSAGTMRMPKASEKYRRQMAGSGYLSYRPTRSKK